MTVRVVRVSISTRGLCSTNETSSVLELLFFLIKMNQLLKFSITPFSIAINTHNRQIGDEGKHYGLNISLSINIDNRQIGNKGKD